MRDILYRLKSASLVAGAALLVVAGRDHADEALDPLAGIAPLRVGRSRPPRGAKHAYPKKQNRLRLAHKAKQRRRRSTATA